MAHAKSTDPNVFILPDLGEGVHEAELISWKVAVGDTVKEHQILAEMETDKALVEVPSPRAGVIKTLHGKPGEILHVGNPLVSYEGAAAASPAVAAKPRAHDAAKAAPSSNGTHEREDAGTVVGSMSDDMAGLTARDGKALAAPAVRRLARDLGLDINAVAGTGIGGRVTAKDVRDAAEGTAAPRQARPTQTSTPAPAAAARPTPSTASATAPGAAMPAESRRPLPPAPAQAPQPAFAQPSYPQPAYAQPAYAQPSGPVPPMPYPPPPYPAAPYGYPYPPMPYPMPYGYPYPPMPYPTPYAMPYGLPHAPPHAGLPFSPGYAPAAGPRPIPDPAQASSAAGTAEARVPFRGVRRTIAQRLRDSVNTAVHFTVMDEADVSRLDAARRDLAQQTGRKLSLLPFIAAAVCRSIAPALGGRFGAMNARVDEASQEIVQFAGVHLGIATDTDSGLMVPVIRDAHTLDALALADAIASTAASARDRSIPRDRLSGSTFTISNVGSHAGRFATPVINAPEVGILAVGKAYDGVAVREGQPAVARLLPLSLACDHRVVDGATAALCLAEIVRRLENAEV